MNFTHPFLIELSIIFVSFGYPVLIMGARITDIGELTPEIKLELLFLKKFTWVNTAKSILSKALLNRVIFQILEQVG